MTYGHDIALKDDPYLAKIKRLLDIVLMFPPERLALLEYIPFREIGLFSIENNSNSDLSGTHPLMASWRTIEATGKRMSCSRKTDSQ